jgi:lipopolysaccharide heptosyltransferase II
VTNILVVRTSSLGDVVMTTPAFAQIKDNIPDSRIFYLTDKSYAPLVRGNPCIYETIEINFEKNSKNILKLIKETSRVIKEIRSCNIDIAFDFQGLLRSVIFVWFSKAKQKYARGNWLFLTKSLPHKRKQPRHNVNQNSDILELSGIKPLKKYSQNIFGAADDIYLGRISENNIQSFEKIIAVNPWTRWPSKCSPARLLADACNIIGEEIRCHFFVLGSEGEHEKAEEVYYGIKHKRTLLAGKLNLNSLAGFLTKTDLLITCDTGPMHMANALGTPLVALFGPTHPIRTGPYDRKFMVLTGEVDCSPCFRRHCPYNHHGCIEYITPKQIAKEGCKFLI